MRVWTTSSFRSLDLLAGPEPSVDAHLSVLDVTGVLAKAVDARASVSLFRQGLGQRRLPIEAPIVGVASDGLVIARPTYKPGQRSLALGESLDLRLGLEGASYVGRTTVRARSLPEGESGPAVRYGLSRPEVLVIDDRRGGDRIGLAYDEPPVAEILCSPRHKPLGSGAIVDLSSGGMRLRGGSANVRAGDRVVVRATLSGEILVHAIATVVHAGTRADGASDIGLRFQSEQPEIQRFIRGCVTATPLTSPVRPAS